MHACDQGYTHGFICRIGPQHWYRCSALAVTADCSSTLFFHYPFHITVYTVTHITTITGCWSGCVTMFAPFLMPPGKDWLCYYHMPACQGNFIWTHREWLNASTGPHLLSFPKSIQLLWISDWTIPHLAGLCSGCVTLLDSTSQYVSSNKKHSKSHLCKLKSLKVFCVDFFF